MAITVRVAGTTFGACDSETIEYWAARQLDTRIPAVIVPDPNNVHDPHVIRVETTRGRLVGYIPKSVNRKLDVLGSEPAHLTVVQHPDYPDRPGIDVTFSLRTADEHIADDLAREAAWSHCDPYEYIDDMYRDDIDSDWSDADVERLIASQRRTVVQADVL